MTKHTSLKKRFGKATSDRLKNEPRVIPFSAGFQSTENETQLERHVESWGLWKFAIEFDPRRVVKRVLAGHDRFENSVETPSASRDLKRSSGSNPNEARPAMSAKYRSRHRSSYGEFINAVSGEKRGIYLFFDATSASTFARRSFTSFVDGV